MQNVKIPVIAGVLALAAVIVTVIIVTSGGGGSGLYVSGVSGDVSVSSASDGTSAPLAADTVLKSGDVVTVGADSRCTLVYRCKDNDGSNYAVLEPSTQIFVTGDFDGKGDSEMYLNRGAVIVTAMTEDKHNIILRTENSSIATAGATVRTAFSVGESNATAIASFGGVVQIQLYDPIGNPVDREGNMAEKSEYMGSGLCGEIISSSTGVPKYDYLNINTELSEYSKTTLRELLTISSGATLAFTPADIKAAFDAASDDPAAAPEEPGTTVTVSETETAVTLPSETVIPESTVSETTAPPVTVTAAPVTTTRVSTTAAPVTTTAAPVTTTAAPVTTTTAITTTEDEPLIDDEPGDDTGGQSQVGQDGEYIDVYIMIDDEIQFQSVPYGGSAEKPADPYVEGKRFIGWDTSFDNITEERTISAIFEDDPSVVTTVEATFYDVTININGQLTVQQVQHGGSAQLPAVNVPGYDFVGWDKTGVNITGDETITAILVPSSGGAAAASYTVTFVIDGASYPVTVQAGQNAAPPFVPAMNSAGQYFLGWDNDITAINSDRTVNAIFG